MPMLTLFRPLDIVVRNPSPDLLGGLCVVLFHIRIINARLAARRERKTYDEYDFSRGVRGKYAERYAAGSNVVVLSPDVAEVFPDSESVNEALRALIKIARQACKKILA
jgi:hypothetical protein